jgi:hypothetical protein
MPHWLIDGLKVAGTSAYAFVAYVCLVAAWLYLATAQFRLNKISKVIDRIPESERTALLSKEYNVLPKAGLSPEQWIRSRKHTLYFLVFLALVVAGLVVTTVALTLHKEVMTDNSAKPVDWQMFLYLREMEFADSSEHKIAMKSCDDEAVTKPDIYDPISLPRNSTIDLMGAVRLVVDNVFSKHQDMIYPVGLSTTWDHTVHTIYDGLDVQQSREGISFKFQRDLKIQATLHTPDSPGLHYILIMSGATLNAQQIFAANVTGKEDANSMWTIPYPELARAVCFGYVNHPFVHPNGKVENATWPILAIPVQIR